MSRLIHKLVLLTLVTSLAPAAFGADTKLCSAVYGRREVTTYLKGSAFLFPGVTAVAIPVAARAFKTLKNAEKAIEVAELAAEFNFVKKYEVALMVGGTVAGVIGRRVLRRLYFDDALFLAMRESEAGVVGEYTRGMANLVNQAVFSAYEYASERIPVKLKLTKRQRSQLSGALNGRRITVDEFAVVLAELMAERTICRRLQKPAEWVEQVVMMQTRDQTRSSR